ncbi:MAG: YebC/PmpR family DNA-binding transcriptional regulator [Candidatus Pacebacteria bacterium]|jgi:YebC/PmpR family DNA-binding regulatory protein|nr:YebC/PmpR family DNA-binding transcriptional regulator [Candidatus Paceibacterota bacterium]
MCGHNKWSQIKRQKGVNDAKRSKVFAKLGKLITMAAKHGGEVEMNPTLKIAVDKARQSNMPADVIKKAIQKGTGELAGGTIEEILYEAYGPEGTPLIIEATTDNNNRTVSEVKHILSKNGGRLGESGSVKWMFDRFGYAEITRTATMDMEMVEMAAIEAGAEDISALDSVVVVYMKPEDLYQVKSEIEKQGFEISESGFEWKAKEKVKASEELVGKIDALFDALDEQEDVNEVYSNLED